MTDALDLAALDEITAAVQTGAGLPTVVRAAARALDASVIVLDRGAQALASAFGTIDALLAASQDQLQAVPDIGPVVAAAVHDYFAQPPNRALISELNAIGILVHRVIWDDARWRPHHVLTTLNALVSR